MTDAGSEFQTDGAAHRKERFAKSVRVNGWMSRQTIIQPPRGRRRPPWLMLTPLAAFYADTLTDGVTLRPSHVPPQNSGILALWHTAGFHDTGRGLWNVFFTARRM